MINKIKLISTIVKADMDQKKTLVYIYNLLEDVLDTFRVLDLEEKKELELQESCWYHQNELLGVLGEFPGREKYYFILPDKVSQNYIEYVCKLFGRKKDCIQVFVPTNKTGQYLGSICQYFIQDQQLLNKFKNTEFDLLSYCVSQKFLELCQIFKENVRLIESFTSDIWEKVKRFSTKPGIRQLVQRMQNPQIFLPNGKILFRSEINFQQTVNLIAQKLKVQNVVVKVEKFFAGRGVLIFKKQQICVLGENSAKDYIKQKMNKPFWKHFDLVIEDYIDSNFNGSSLCLNFHRIKWQSIINLDYSHDNVRIKRLCGDLSRGYINFDFHVDKQGIVYLGEANVRRSASLFIHQFQVFMSGNQYLNDHYLMTHTINSTMLAGLRFEDLLNKIEELSLNYSKQKGYGVVISSSAALKSGVLEIFTVTKTRKEAFEINQKLSQLYN